MIVTMPRIIQAVREMLDLNSVDGGLRLEGDRETLDLDRVIVGKVCDGVRLVHMSAPVWLLEHGHQFGPGRCVVDETRGWVELPDDFLRLVVFRMSDWERPVHTALHEGSAEYQLQSSRYAGVRGTPERPVCAIVSRGHGRVLEYYGTASSSSEVAEAVYIPEPRIEHGGVDISERCVRAAMYAIGWLTADTLSEYERGKDLENKVKMLLG